MSKTIKALNLCLALLTVLGLMTPRSLAQKDNTNAALKKVLNSKGYVLSSPAENWPYAGGFLVANNKTATFIDLPSNVTRPNVQSVSADFPAESQTKKFSLSAVLTGMLALIGGNPGGGFGHSSNMTFKELQSTGSRITYQQAQALIADSNIQTTVKNWLKTSGQKVYILGVVLTTEHISVTSNSATNLDLSFNGSAVSKCSDTSTSDKNSTTPGPQQTSTPTKAGTAKSDAPTASRSASTTPSTAAGASTQGASAPASSNLPGGELHLCMNNSNSLTMNTDTPLVFAAGAYRVTLLKDGGFNLEPIMQTSPSGTMEQGGQMKHRVTAAATVNSSWTRQPWPGTSRQ